MTATPTDRDRAEAHKLLVWAEGFTRDLTWDQKIEHIATALATARQDEEARQINRILRMVKKWTNGGWPRPAATFADLEAMVRTPDTAAIRQPGQEES